MSVTHCLVNGADRGDWLFCVKKRHKWEVVRAARSWRVQWRARRSEANQGAAGITRGSHVSSLAKTCVDFGYFRRAPRRSFGWVVVMMMVNYQS